MTDERFPFLTPATSDARMFIQWKGTNVCLDFWCPCGVQSHLDESFAYYIHCPACSTTYQMGTQVIVRKVAGIGPGDPTVQVLDVDEEEE